MTIQTYRRWNIKAYAPLIPAEEMACAIQKEACVSKTTGIVSCTVVYCPIGADAVNCCE